MTDDGSIAYQGEPGANSHIACVETFPDFAPLPCPTFEDAFAAIQDGSADLGMIPIENSIAGPGRRHPPPAAGVRTAHRRRDLPADPFPAAGAPGARIEDLRPSTATSTRSASAATSSAATAEAGGRGRHRGLGARGGRVGRPEPRRARDRARRPRSTASRRSPATSRTRRTTPPASSCWRRATQWAPPGNGPVVTTFVFRVRNIPAALYKALGGFATNGVNMTKLESYMVEGEFAATQFFADVDGHPDDPPLARALEELAFFSREVRILGVYPAHPFRIETQTATTGCRADRGRLFRREFHLLNGLPPNPWAFGTPSVGLARERDGSPFMPMSDIAVDLLTLSDDDFIVRSSEAVMTDGPFRNGKLSSSFGSGTAGTW